MSPARGTQSGKARPHGIHDPTANGGFPEPLRRLIASIANRDAARSEATLQADIRQLLTAGDFGLEEHDLDTIRLEAQAGGGHRIDIELGFTVIEVKRKLGHGRAFYTAERQLADYLKLREHATGQRYTGILTDGADWHAYHLLNDTLVKVAVHSLSARRPDGLALFYWLEGVLATRTGIPPTPTEIVQRLGATSTSHQLDLAAVTELYERHKDLDTVKLKRKLWADLLSSALGTQFVDEDHLFIEHTLLINSAHIIAHLVVGLDVLALQPATLVTGHQFERSHIFGVVEHDFFGWTIEVADGTAFLRGLARRLTRFDWSSADHDVLKILYESIIGTDMRRRMGEYYTPDWLAEGIVASAMTDPLHQRVLDPSCGSGTFLFHAVRTYLTAAETANRPLETALTDLSRHVSGVDLHPVAVALARVTYLLAIGRDRLASKHRGPITIPVYLGDSIQWRERLDLFTEDHMRLNTGYGSGLHPDFLRFPRHLLDDPSRFDRIVLHLAELAAKPRDRDTVPSLQAFFYRMAIADADQPMIAETFGAMCRLQDDGRNHIWSYYLRNLARPIWFAMPENRVDLLVGNPPWLTYRTMSADMKSDFKTLSQDRGLWHGGGVATHQDLSGLFIARAAQQYLKPDGTFAFVMPNAALDRGYFHGFRSGWYHDKTEPTALAFTATWDLRRLRPHLFLRGSAVVFGTRTSMSGRQRMSSRTDRWSGQLPATGTWEQMLHHVDRQPAELAVQGPDVIDSPYRPRFGQGATIVPRLLFFVDTRDDEPLGFHTGHRSVRSSRSNYEKAPWKDLADLEGVIEDEFIHPVLLGENVLPYRVLPAREAVIPLERGDLLDSTHQRLDYYPGLADWWRQAERVWETHRSSSQLSLAQQLDFRRKLTTQLPVQPLRLAYSASGMHVAAAIVEDPRAIVEHNLYWATIVSRLEGLYLSAILNSPTLTDLVRPMMSYGKDERHIDKHIWNLPIPLFDPANPDHQQLATLGEQQHDLVARLPLDSGLNFISQRRRIRAELAKHSSTATIAILVTDLLA
jgi:SAM-dependent methyltransferase